MMIIIYINIRINYIYSYLHHYSSGTIMKIRDVIQEFVPCEVCGNRDIKNFYFHVLVHKGSQPFVKCGDCEEEFYSTKAREIITRVEDSRRIKARSALAPNNSKFTDRNTENMHPLLKILSQV